MSDTQKHTKPNVPNLRFPGFEGEWEKKRIREIGSFYSGGTPSSSKKEFYGGDIPFIRSGEIHLDKTELFLTEEGYNNSSAKMVAKGDIVLALYGANSGDISICKINGAINQAILCIKTDIVSAFFKSVWEKHAQKILNTYLQGGQGNLSADIVKSIILSIPSKHEQQKIAGLFSLLDERIAIQNKVIERYQSLIRAIIQQSQRNSSLRVYLREIMRERKELNAYGYDICSVSVSKGVVNQVEYLGRSFAAKETSHYHVVKEGDLVYTKSPTGEFPFGIIKQSCIKKAIAVSPLYGVYEPKSLEIGTYLHYLFCSPQNTQNYLRKLIQKGAKNTINITNQHFLDNQVCLPGPEDLSRIVCTINSLAKRIEIEELYVGQILKQKSYLLQQLFI